MNLILAIDTSCDETSAAVTDGRRVLSNVISSQITIHKKYGGVYPALAKRAHEERIDWVIREALGRAGVVIARSETTKQSQKNEVRLLRGKAPRNDKLCPQFQIGAVAVTQGPGLAIALEVGIRKAKELVGQSHSDPAREARREKNPDDDNRLTVLSDILISPTGSFGPIKSDLWMTNPFQNDIKLIAVNHLEGHIYSCFTQRNSRLQSALKNKGRELKSPSRGLKFATTFQFPALCLIVSGGHTQLTLMKDHGVYETIGQTLDDACGEALDKAAKILKLGYPGGPIIERLAEEYLRKQMSSRGVPSIVVERRGDLKLDRLLRGKAPRNDNNIFQFSKSLPQKSNLNFSYSGLKTQLLYLVNSLAENEFNENLNNLAYSFQSACFDQIVRKTSEAIKIYQPNILICGGGVIANKYLRKILRQLAKKYSLKIYFPPNKKLITDNAAMIGVAAYYHFLRKDFVNNPESLEREPRLSL